MTTNDLNTPPFALNENFGQNSHDGVYGDYYINPTIDDEDVFWDSHDDLKTKAIKVLSESYNWTKEKLKLLYEMIKMRIKEAFGYIQDELPAHIRTIGIRVREALSSLLALIKSGIESMGPQFIKMWDFIETTVRKVIDSDIVARIAKLALDVEMLPFNIAVKHMCSTIVVSIILLLTQYVFDSTLKRIFVSAVTIIISYLQGFGNVKNMTIVAAFLETLRQLKDYKPKPQVTTTEIRDDVKEFAIASLGCVTALYCCSLGLEAPTDAKSLDALLKRHSLLGNAFKTWEKVAEYFSELFVASLKIITKYIFKEKWIAPHHIEEIEVLYYRVMELIRLDNTFQLGRNIELSYEVEGLYHNFLYLRKVYSGNKDAIQKLDLISGPLTTMYKTVSMSNPRSMVMRKEPVCIVLKGPSGIGKSYMITPLQQALLKINGTYAPDLDLSGFIYSRAAENEFWDSYKGQPVVIYDDFGQRVDSAQNPNPEFFELIRGVNIFPWQLHSAAIHEKANNPMQADFFVLTTNLQNFDRIPSIISNDALQRRLHLIYQVNIIDEVATNGKLDVEKLKNYRLANNLPDFDNSHYKFVNEYTNEPLDYNGILKEISLQFKKHLESFVQRTNMANRTAEERLPEGVYSTNPRWAHAQIDVANIRIPLNLFLNLPREDRRRLLGQGIRVYDVKFELLEGDVVTVENLEMFHNRCDIDPLVAVEVERQVLAYLSDTYPAYNWCGLLEKWWKGRLTSKHVEAIIDFRTGNFMKHIKTIFKYCATFIGCVSVAFGLYRCVQFFTSKCYLETKLWSSMKQLLTLSATINLTKLLGVRELFGIPLAYFNGVGELLIYTRCINSYCYSCRCEECSGKQTMAQIERISPQIMDFVKANADNPETLRRLDTLIQEIELESERVGARGKTKTKFEEEPESLRPDRAKPKVKHEQDDVILTGDSESERVGKVRTVKKNYESELSEFDVATRAYLESERPNGDRRKVRKGAIVEGVISCTTENIAAKVRRQTLVVHWKNRNGTWKRMGQCFVICGKWTAINAHFFQYMKSQGVKPESHLKFTAIGQEEGFMMSIHDIMKTIRRLKRGIEETEFYLFQIDRQPYCNMIKHFMSVAESAKLTRGVKVRMVTSVNESNIYQPMNRDGTFTDIETIQLQDLDDPDISHIYPNCGTYDICSQEGDCGSVMLANSDMFNGKIFGLHHSGGYGEGHCSLIFKEDLTKIIEDAVTACEPQLEKDKFEICDFDFPLKGSFFPIGKSETPVVQPCNTKLTHSEIFEAFGPTTVAPAVLEPALKPDGPMLKGLKKYEKPSVPINHDLLQLAIKSYEDKLYSGPSPTEIETSLLTFEEACAGITGNEFFPPLNKSKSAGFPLCFEATKGKHKWFGSEDWDFSRKEWIQLKEELLQEESMLKQGQVPNYVFVDTLKDEKRPIEKVLAKKTRVFAAAPMKFSILFRRYYSGFLAYCARTKIRNEIAVGTSASSEDWGNIVRHLQFNSQTPTMIAGDFSNFDGTVHYAIFEEIGEMIDRWYNDDHSKVRRLLWGCISQAKHICYDMIYQMSHGQPSGNPSTAVSNSIYNSVAIRYVIGTIMGPEMIKGFNSHFRVITYGDDNIISVHPKLLNTLKPSQLSEGFEQLGMTYTSEDKAQITDKYRLISEVSFLKREFSYDEERKWWFAPLSLTSIQEMCYWTHKSSNNLEATRSNCNQAIAELTMHSEKTYYDFIVKIRRALRNKGSDVSYMKWNVARDIISSGNWKQIFTEEMCWM